MKLEGVLVEDHQHDTLLYAGELQVRLTDWFFFKKNIELKYIGLQDAVIHLQRTDSVWNYQFMVDYFSTPPSTRKKEGGDLELQLKKLDFKNVVLRKKDGWRGEDQLLYLGGLDLDAK